MMTDGYKLEHGYLFFGYCDPSVGKTVRCIRSDGALVEVTRMC